MTDPVEETQALRTSDIVERVQAEGLLFEPGARRLCSSAGYTCLARVIEVIEDRPFEVVLVERVFRSARMADATSETGQQLMPDMAMPYGLGTSGRQIVVKSAPHKDFRFLTGAGSVYGTAEDLLHFVQSVREGVFGDDLFDDAFGGDSTTWHGWLVVRPRSGFHFRQRTLGSPNFAQDFVRRGSPDKRLGVFIPAVQIRGNRVDQVIDTGHG